MAVKIKNFVKTIIFIVLGLVIIWFVSQAFGVSNEYSEHAEMMLKGYYEEPENTVDAVFIGNSHVYRYWQSAFAWEQHGISSLSISTSDMPYGAAKNVTIEAGKTQKPKVIVIDATVFANSKDNANNKIYLLIENMKYSKNYFDMIGNFCKFADVHGMDKLKYYIPLIQFHSRWTDLSELDFRQTQPSYLNSCYQEEFLNYHIKGGKHIDTDKRKKIAPRTEAALRDLLEWCQQQDTEILFFAAPILKKEAQLARINYIGDVVNEYGIDFIDYNDAELYESCGFDEKVDFQDKNHTNVKGSYKFTQVFGEYLKERYGLENHKGKEAYASWDERTAAYFAIVEPYMNVVTE